MPERRQRLALLQRRRAQVQGRLQGAGPLQPDPVVGRDGDDLLLRNFEGRVYRYPDPDGTLARESLPMAAE